MKIVRTLESTAHVVPALMFVLACCAGVSAQAPAMPDLTPVITPGTDGPLSASQISGGAVQLENELMRFIFEPRDGGAASSIVFKPTGKELAVCVTYSEQVFRAFRENLQLEGNRETRVSPNGPSYQLIRLEAAGGKAVAAFTGYPWARGDYSKLRVVKTYTLRKGSSSLDVEVRAWNEGDKLLQTGFWIQSGVRVQGEDVDVFARPRAGTTSRVKLWTKLASSNFIVAQSAEPWTGAVARDAARSGLYVAAGAGMVEGVNNWLAKFPGFTLGFGTPLNEVGTGGSTTVAYTFVAMTGLPRIDGAASRLACGVNLDDSKIEINKPFDVSVAAVSPTSRDANVVVTMRRLPSADETNLGESPIRFEASKASATKFTATVPKDGTYVIAATFRSGDEILLRAERPFIVGVAEERYDESPPELAGKSFWREHLGGGRSSDWMQSCDRSVRYPMIPWSAPCAGKPPKVLFVGQVGHTTGLIRDLARRAGVEWDHVNLYGLEEGDGPYRETEQKIVEKKLEQMKPDCVVTVGIRYESATMSLIQRLLDGVKDGMGLVLIVRPGQENSGPWPAIVKRPDMVKSDANVTGLLGSIFDAGVAPAPFGTTECYEYGKGRIVLIVKDLVFTGTSYAKNDMLPQNRGNTMLPDWEYHFAQYVRAIRVASRAASPARIVEMKLTPDSIEVVCESDKDRKAAIEYDVVSTDLLRGEHGIGGVTLKAGRNTMSLKTRLRPAEEYVLHAWILDGEPPATEEITDDGASLLNRERHPAPVMDFNALCAKVEGPVRIEQIEIAGASERVPTSITVKLARPADGTPAGEFQVIAEIRNGGDTRIAWRGNARCTQGGQVTFDKISYLPVSLESMVAVKVRSGSAISALARAGEPLCMKGRRFNAKITGNIADDDVAYIAATGVQYDWYGTRMLKPWAVEQAGFDPIYYQYGDLTLGIFGIGLDPGQFPWKRIANNMMTPPFVDETPLRTGLAANLRKVFDEIGTTYFCLSDEFRLDGEYDWSPETLQAFAQHLKGLYGTTDRLNAEWGTSYAKFEDARPILLDEAQKNKDNVSRWLDFRIYIDSRMTRRFEVAGEEAAKISPLIRIGESGMEVPSYDVGMNYYDVSRNSRFMMTYPGLRAEWTHAFLRDDGITGTWLGYGHQEVRDPWVQLFAGHNILGWWGYMAGSGFVRMATIRADLLPNQNFNEIGRYQAEIRRGIGKLFVTAKRAEPRVFISYSQPSMYVKNVYEISYYDVSERTTGLFSSGRIAYSFIADEQAAGGAIDKMNDKLFVLAGSDAMADAAAAAYARAVERGCFILADSEAAWRDGHGKRLTAGGLDGAFGVNRAKASPGGSGGGQITWTANAPEELRQTTVQMDMAITGLEAKGDTIWATFPNGAPAVIAKPSGAGSLAVLVNTRMEAGDLSVMRVLARFLLNKMNIRPPAEVAPEGLKPDGVTERANGRARYYGLLLSNRRGEAFVTLAEKAHTYDVRAGKYFGLVESFNDQFDPSSLVKIYAQLPYAVKGISAATDAAVKRPGETVNVTGAIEAEGGATEYHVIHCEVLDPKGGRPRYYVWNIGAPEGKFSIQAPLALNALSGRWLIELTDVATGTRGRAQFTVAGTD